MNRAEHEKRRILQEVPRTLSPLKSFNLKEDRRLTLGIRQPGSITSSATIDFKRDANSPEGLSQMSEKHLSWKPEDSSIVQDEKDSPSQSYQKIIFSDAQIAILNQSAKSFMENSSEENVDEIYKSVARRGKGEGGNITRANVHAWLFRNCGSKFLFSFSFLFSFLSLSLPSLPFASLLFLNFNL